MATVQPVEGDVNISYRLEAAMITTFIAAAIVVGLRFIARILYARLGWDDYLMMLATVYVPRNMRRQEFCCKLGSVQDMN